jgi:guanine nucleotide-binding protein subunit alpha
MGNCLSVNSENIFYSKNRTAQIDRSLEEDAKQLRKECKILLLGSGESGKSTIVKQMKIIHQQGFNTEELKSYRVIVARNVLDSIKAVLSGLNRFQVTGPLERHSVRRFRGFFFNKGVR